MCWEVIYYFQNFYWFSTRRRFLIVPLRLTSVLPSYLQCSLRSSVRDLRLTEEDAARSGRVQRSGIEDWRTKLLAVFSNSNYKKNNTTIHNGNHTDNAFWIDVQSLPQRSKIKLTRSLPPPRPRSPATSPCSRPASPRSSSPRRLRGVGIRKRRSVENQQRWNKCGVTSSKSRPTHPPPTRWSWRCPWWSRRLCNILI